MSLQQSSWLSFSNWLTPILKQSCQSVVCQSPLLFQQGSVREVTCKKQNFYKVKRNICVVGTSSEAGSSSGAATTEPPPPHKAHKKGYLQILDDLQPFVNNSICELGPSGYDNSEPPVLDGEGACPHCHLAPCVVARPPSWLRGSASANLGNISKRFTRYSKFWTLLGQLGVWSHPLYLEYKQTKTAIHDKREVMPDCVLRVSHNLKLTNIKIITTSSQQDVRRRFPNPDGVPYTDYQPTSRYIAQKPLYQPVETSVTSTFFLCK